MNFNDYFHVMPSSARQLMRESQVRKFRHGKRGGGREDDRNVKCIHYIDTKTI